MNRGRSTPLTEDVIFESEEIPHALSGKPAGDRPLEGAFRKFEDVGNGGEKSLARFACMENPHLVGQEGISDFLNAGDADVGGVVAELQGFIGG